MQTFPIDKPRVLTLYSKSDCSGQELLKKAFGEKFFMPVQERIQSFEDACEDQGLNPDEIRAQYASIPEPFRKQAITRRELLTIAKSWREGWEPDYDNGSQEKWLCWIIRDSTNPAGFRFLVSYCDGTYTDAGAGSGLCMATEKLATAFTKQFLPLLAVLMTE
jgi:hypothetical protein